MSNGVRLRFSKGDPVRFLSHLDVLRTIERAIRRSKLPIAYSEGFHPKQKIAFAHALPVGVTSKAEYMDLQMNKSVSGIEVQEALNTVLPPGFRISDSAMLPERTASLMSIVKAATYRLAFLKTVSFNGEEVVKQLLAAEQLMVDRQTKKGIRRLDIRPMVYVLQWSDNCLYVQGACGSEQNLRPTEISSLLTVAASDVLVERIELLVPDVNGKWVTPLDVVKEL